MPPQDPYNPKHAREGLTRDGHPVRFWQCGDVGPFCYLGYVIGAEPHGQHLWRRDMFWREDGKHHQNDIVRCTK